MDLRIPLPNLKTLTLYHLNTQYTRKLILIIHSSIINHTSLLILFPITHISLLITHHLLLITYQLSIFLHFNTFIHSYTYTSILSYIHTFTLHYSSLSNLFYYSSLINHYSLLITYYSSRNHFNFNTTSLSYIPLSYIHTSILQYLNTPYLIITHYS